MSDSSSGGEEEEENDILSLSVPITLEECYEQWEDTLYTGPRQSDVMMFKLALQFDHDKAFEKFKDVTLHDLLSVDFLQMWRYPEKTVMTMRMSTLIATIHGLEWALLSTLNPVMRNMKWLMEARRLLEALRARFYYLVCHAPLSSRILDNEEDYAVEYQFKIDEDEEHDPDKLNQTLGLDMEDYETDPLVIQELKKKKQLSGKQFDWNAIGMGEDNKEEEEEEEGDDKKKPLQWDKDGQLIITDESVEIGTFKKAVPMMATMEFVHDISWDFYCMDEAFDELDSKKERIVVPDPNLTKIRMHLAARAKTSWDSIAVARKQYQYNIQCTGAYVAKHRRRTQQENCTSTEVLSSRMMAIIDKIEPLPESPKEMFKRTIGPMEKENQSFITSHLTAHYWSNRTQELNAGWVRVNTDFLFQTIGGMEIEKGDAIDYVLRTGKITRLKITGKWVLYHKKKQYLCDSMTGAYRQMRVLQRAHKSNSTVFFMNPDLDLEMPATIQLCQFDSYLDLPSNAS